MGIFLLCMLCILFGSITLIGTLYILNNEPQKPKDNQFDKHKYDKLDLLKRLELLKIEVRKDMPDSHSSLIVRGINKAILEVIKSET